MQSVTEEVMGTFMAEYWNDPMLWAGVIVVVLS